MSDFTIQNFYYDQKVNQDNMNGTFTSPGQQIAAFFPKIPNVSNGIGNISNNYGQIGTTNQFNFANGVFQFPKQIGPIGSTLEYTSATYTSTGTKTITVPTDGDIYYIVAELSTAIIDPGQYSTSVTILTTAMTLTAVNADTNKFLPICAIVGNAGVYTVSLDNNCAYNYGVKLESYMQGRIYGISGEPLADTTVDGSPILYFGNYNGNLISLYNGFYWVTQTFNETSYNLSLLANAAVSYDVYITSTGVNAVSMSFVQWSGSIPPGRSIQDGKMVKLNTPTALFVGAITINGSKRISDYSERRYLVNQYNTINKTLHFGSSAVTITSTTPQIQGIGVATLIINPAPLTVTNSVNNIQVLGNTASWGNTGYNGSTLGNSSSLTGTGNFPCSFTSITTPVTGVASWKILWWVASGSAFFGGGHLTIQNIFV